MASLIPRGRFNDAKEIIQCIDEKQKLITELRFEANDLAKRAKDILDKIQDWPDGEKRDRKVENARKLSKRSERRHCRADNIEKTYMPRLKARLAVMMTDQLPGVETTDQSIPK